MREQQSYSYAIVRVVPRVEREEFINVGVLLYCQAERYLRASIELDEPRLHALWPVLELAPLREQLTAFAEVADGRATHSPISALSVSERFHWLAAARSTVVQVSPVHTGVCTDLDARLDKLMAQYVALPPP